ncbi:putative short chain dehydrogenase/reductase family oxidoreductase [Aspergillus bombycis]|uniref:Putative short chain dehydrogenase/reductase family oxidoreductase n=1 Tax=Aspergillus bombycis TaxID=109264 RepID=A0A1F8ADV6_9EURO|nr:putative short chain dehydrogenase/reductase family oxidoreductase [Aspergillus bombycis]OGM49857.1 putative short chain dehydrogenase/reductase family oxidoreductase [Aspergillus bombycis]
MLYNPPAAAGLEENPRVKLNNIFTSHSCPILKNTTPLQPFYNHVCQYSNSRRGLPLLVTPETCAGRTYVVTGANSGLGLEAARHLVNAGARKVILAVRNLTAGEKAKDDIETCTGKTGVAEVWLLDLASYDSVKAFAQRVTTELDRIDAVIENAGVALSQRLEAEGHILPVTVNVLSTLLLGVLIFPKLRDSAQRYGTMPHLVFVTSVTGFDCHEAWRDIHDEPLAKMHSEDMNMMQLYPLTKLMLTIAVRHLATLTPVDRTGVVMNLVCPGLCKTDIGRNAPAEVQESVANFVAQCGRTAEDGSRTLLHGAVAGRESHGRFLQSCESGENIVPHWVKNEEGRKWQRYSWEDIAKELEFVCPGCIQEIIN